MWKKDDTPEETSAPGGKGTWNPDRSSRGPAPPQQATIGRSIRIRGEVSGDEDLLIQGHVDGSVNLKDHAVTVGPEGDVKANITGRIVTVEGKVEGDLTGAERVILRGSAEVAGDITAPRVVLEDGVRFRGGVEMGAKAQEKPPSGSPAPSQAPIRSEPSKSSQSSRSEGESDRSSATKEKSTTDEKAGVAS